MSRSFTGNSPKTRTIPSIGYASCNKKRPAAEAGALLLHYSFSELVDGQPVRVVRFVSV